MLRVRPFTAAIGVALSVLLSPTTRAQEATPRSLLFTKPPPKAVPAVLLTPELLTITSPDDAGTPYKDGTFVIHVLVGVDGKVTKAEAKTCSPDLLTETAAARRWTRRLRFRAGTEDGEPVASSTTVTLTLGAGGPFPTEECELRPQQWAPDNAEPKLVKRFAPKYPQELANQGVEGKVVMRLSVDEKGQVTNVTLLAGVHPVLDRLSMKAAKLHRYAPATHDGKPVKSTARLVMRWELLGGGARPTPTPMRKSKRTDKRPRSSADDGALQTRWCSLAAAA